MLAFVNDTGILVVVVVLMVIFGAGQIPKVARNLAQAGKEFRKAQADIEADQPRAPNDV